SPYFYPGHRFRQALRRAADRGVRVRLLLQGKLDYRIAGIAASVLYDELLAHGVRIYEYTPAFLHAKVAVVDDEWATVGSSNSDPACTSASACCFRLSAAAADSSTSAAFCCVTWSSCPMAVLTCPMPLVCCSVAALISLTRSFTRLTCATMFCIVRPASSTWRLPASALSALSPISA